MNMLKPIDLRKNLMYNIGENLVSCKNVFI